jgi:hypothetical protein
MTKFKLTLNYITPEGKSTTRLMTVELSKPVETSKAKRSYYNNELIHRALFSIKIPDEVHKKMLGQSVPQNQLGRGRDQKDYSDFKKTMSAPSVEALTTNWYELMVDYQWVLTVENMKLTKVIFFQFESDSKQTASSWDSKVIGKLQSLDVQTFVGYIGTEKGKEVRFNEVKKQLHISFDEEYYRFKYVEYTDERMEFFNNFHQAFDKVIDKIEGFENNLNEKGIDAFISSPKAKLLT